MDLHVSYFYLRGTWHQSVPLEEQAVGPGSHSTGKGLPVGVGCSGGKCWPDGGDPVRGLGHTAGGVHLGGRGQLARAGHAGRGCCATRGGLVVGGSPPPGVGCVCVGAGGQEVHAATANPTDS